MNGGVYLWEVMVSEFPCLFSGEYPSTDEERRNALNDFIITKRYREEAWITENAPKFQAKLENIVPGFSDKLLWSLVLEYATPPFTWIDVAD